MLTKYEEEEVVVKKQNDEMMHKGDIVTTPTFFTGEFSSVVMEEPVEIHVDDAREITINPDIWQDYVRQWIVPRPDEPDITYERIANLQRLGYNASEIAQMIDL